MCIVKKCARRNRITSPFQYSIEDSRKLLKAFYLYCLNRMIKKGRFLFLDTLSAIK